MRGPNHRPIYDYVIDILTTSQAVDTDYGTRIPKPSIVQESVYADRRYVERGEETVIDKQITSSQLVIWTIREPEGWTVSPKDIIRDTDDMQEYDVEAVRDFVRERGIIEITTIRRT